jgi:hypothetical protein
MRKLKALGLALVAVLAMSAMAAATAQANEKADFSAAGTHIHATNANEGTHTFNIPGFPTLTCTEVSGTGTLAKESPELTGEAISYKTCHIVSGFTFPVTVDMNGCHYLFTAGTYTKDETSKAGISDGSIHIKCPVGKEITITVMSLDHKTVRCTIHVPEQTPKGTVTFRNETTEKVMAVTAVADKLEVTATVTDSNVLGCDEHIHTEKAVYEGSFWGKATNAAKEFVDATVTGTPL